MLKPMMLGGIVFFLALVGCAHSRDIDTEAARKLSDAFMSDWIGHLPDSAFENGQSFRFRSAARKTVQLLRMAARQRVEGHPERIHNLRRRAQEFHPQVHLCRNNHLASQRSMLFLGGDSAERQHPESNFIWPTESCFGKSISVNSR
jgi:hypothetical protein